MPGKPSRFHFLPTLLAAALLLLPAAAAATIRYERHTNTIYVERTATTLSGIKAAVPEAPLKLVDRERRIWLLSADLMLASGGALRLYGRRAGGDVDELRLKSNSSHAPHSFVSITADYGHLDIRSTRITSWDTALGQPDLEHETYGRAFIRARSRLRSMVLIPLESRMDITDSEIQYLGYNANESYGLVWKVVAPQRYVFDYVRIYGNVRNSRIHDNYFGLYTAGASGSEWRGNKVYHNVQYGMAPHTRSDDLRIEENDVHDNGHHGITVRQQCLRTVIRNNRSWGNGESGITLHGGVNGAVIAANRVFLNRQAGIVVYASSSAVVRDNVVLDNGHAGVQLVMGTHDTRVLGNQIGDNGFYGVFVGRGKGRPRAGDGLPRRNRIADNVIYGSGTEDIRTDPTGYNIYANNVLPPPAPATEVAAPARPPDPAPVSASIVAAEPAAAPEPRPAEPRFATLRNVRDWDIPPPVLWTAALVLVGLLWTMYGKPRGTR